MDRKNYIIIGGSAAGMAAAVTVRQLDDKGAITVLTDEPDFPYFRPMIPFLISGKKTPADITLKNMGPYQIKDIDIRTQSCVKNIDSTRQHVTLTNKEQLPYDRLLIASGSHPAVPADLNIKDIEGVFTLRTLAQAQAICKRAQMVKHVVMLGGGMLNTKAALALCDLGIEVTIIELEAEILPWLMEADAAGLIHKALKEKGIDIKTGCTISQIEADQNGVCSVVLNTGKDIACQMVCVGVGIEPNVAFLNQSNLNVDHGVVVDPYTKTNVSNIFAAGDVAAQQDTITGKKFHSGLWTNAVEMGRTAGRNMAGYLKKNQGFFSILNATQVGDIPFVSMGMVHTAGTEYESHVAAGKEFYRKLVFSKNGSTLMGAIFVGNIENAGLYRYMIREQKDISVLKHYIIDHAIHYGHLL